MSTQVDGLRRFVGSRKRTPWRPSDRPVLVVAGATGGTGASTVAALLALASAQAGRRTLLIDTDENVGVQHRILGVDAPHGLGALLNPDAALDTLLVSVASDCLLLPGGPGSDTDGAPFDPTARRTVLRRAAQGYDAFDAVVLDAGSRLDGIVAAAEGGVRRFLVVTGVTPVAIASAYAVVKTVETRWRGVAVDVLFNRQSPEAGRSAFEQIHHAAGHFLRRTVGFAGVLADDPALGTAPDLPLHRCSRATELTMQQLATALLTETHDAPRV